MVKLVPHDIRFFATPAELRDWFDENHATGGHRGLRGTHGRTVRHWVTSAKQPATRERRLARLIEDSGAGRPVGPMAWARKPE